MQSLTPAQCISGSGGGSGVSNEDSIAAAAPSVTGMAASSVISMDQLTDHSFRFWCDELLWAQGSVATETIEHVLRSMGGVRTGGPRKQQQQQQQRTVAAPGSKDDQMSAIDAVVEPLLGVVVTDPAAAAAAAAAATSSDLGGSTAARLAGSAATAVGRHRPTPAAAAASRGAITSAQDTGSSDDTSVSSTRRCDEHLLGYRHPHQWDLLWTKSVYAIKAARSLRQGQQVSALAGLNCLTMKKRMVQTLSAALGEAAWTITPLSFCIPEELPAWRAWLSSSAARKAPGGDTGYWMLKTGQDAGRGLRLAATPDAPAAAARPPRHPGRPHTHVKVAQRYITDPLLVSGRKFHLRLWLLVTGHSPLRAYLHDRGLVLFSSEQYPCKSSSGGGGGGGGGSSSGGNNSLRPAAAHVTNLARNVNTWVWELPQLRAHLGEVRWTALWADLRRSAAATAAAALGPLRAAHAWLSPRLHDYGFQMVGLDYLIDESMTPWLLEVNSAPSIMAVHADPGTAELIRAAKQAMLHDMMTMVSHRIGSSSDSSVSSSAASHAASCGGGAASSSWRAHLDAELAAAGGFQQLMGEFPVGFMPGIPWQEADVALREVLVARGLASQLPP